jgi:acetate---CoA ligase (ADP-forming)
MPVDGSEELNELFAPRSVAVIGASNKPGTVGTTLFRNILQAGYKGVAYPVNPNWPSVSGVHCYPNVAALPEVPDLAIVIVPAALVAGVVEEIGQTGTRGVVVISAGFREVGGAGIGREEEVIRLVRRYRMSLVGPNCFGLLNTDPQVSLNATFSSSLPPRGNIAFISQSGALGAGIIQYGISERIGFSRFVSVGNRAGVDENDLLRSCARDPATRVILLYVESLADGRRFLEAAREVTETKPVLVIKSGRTPEGERAVRSHTGSLAQSGRDQLYDSLFDQAGVIRTETIGDLFRTAKVFSSGIDLEGPRLAILTNSGGPGILAADAASRHGLRLAALNDRERSRLAQLLSPSASAGNPIDTTADTSLAQIRSVMRILLRSPRVDGALVIMTPTSAFTSEAAGHAILEGRGKSPKAVTACLFGVTDVSEAVTFLEQNGVPAFTFPEEAVQGLGSLAQYHSWRTRPRTEVRRFEVDLARARAAIARARRAGLTVLPQYASREILAAYGIAFPEARRVREESAALRAADEVGYPVVLKVVSPDISHKTDVGGVRVDLRDRPMLREAYREMAATVARRAPNARIEGYEVEAQVLDGKEVLIGLQRDPGFGPVLVFGLGGIYVEILRDVTFRLAPVRTLSARHMIEQVKAFPLLQGTRGEPPSDLDALAEAIERVSQLAVELPQVAELDINPLIARPAGKGVVAVDARVVLGPPSTPEPSVSARQSGTGPRRMPGRDGRTPRPR